LPAPTAYNERQQIGFLTHLPLINGTVTALSPAPILTTMVGGTSLVCLAVLGAIAARAGGALMAVAAIRVTFWSSLAMGLTAAVGAMFGVAA
jgi:VIT1/CCC1 family predicted Fe2+/Mn2+ transporter